MTRGPEDETNRNMIIAVVLSLLIFMPYQYFVLEPMQRQQKAAIMADRAAKGLPPTGSTQKGAPGEGSASPAAPVTRAAAVAESVRVRFDAPGVDGSIALDGGRIDDLSLKRYRETVDPA